MTLRILFIIGYGGSHLRILKEVCEEESKSLNFECIAVTDEGSASYLNLVDKVDAIVMYTSSLPREVLKAIEKSNAKIILSFSDSFQEYVRGVEILEEAWKYFKLGGKENLRGLIRLILKRLGLNIDVPQPVEVPWHGIWHPRHGIFTNTNKYLEIYPYSSKPLVGLVFYRSRWLNKDTAVVEQLIDALESEGLGVIPVFTHGFRDSILSTPTIEDTMSKFFIINDRSVVDAVILLTSFFVLDHGKWHRRSSKESFAVAAGINILKKLNVPIIMLVQDHYQSINEWINNPSGISPLAQVYHVIMPEVDGAIEPIFIAGSEKDLNGIKTYEPYSPHIKYVAKRVRKWVELRRAPRSERRIAIVLNNPPCRGVEASIGAAMGLDVPETIVRILHRLYELGYNVGDPNKLPRDGRELMKMFLDKRATSEFRWTSVEDIVKRGGYLDMVPMEKYLEWFSELPDDVRKRMAEVWGDPKSLKGGIFSGAIYEGKFVVPGLRFGNVVIVPQPKFGCAGSVCDGRACKILHDPTTPPPHQWLAVYRWITRVFKANLILHVGTHGTLEFRPGKGVGLSPLCWPEISIDDVPFGYIYIVSNPMEGVIAKRRGYSVVVDHVYPPMMDARGGLEELDKLVEEYEKLKRLGEEHRANIVIENIRSSIQKLGLAIKHDLEPDRLVAEVHRMLDLIRSSQVEAGLHVFGYTEHDVERLAKSVVTVMEFDTYSWQSILRACAMYIGINYDDIVSNPNGFCEKLGMSNRKVKEFLIDVATKAIEKLLKGNVRAEDLDLDTLFEVLDSSLHEVMGKWNLNINLNTS